jgi:hypothetical protein
LSHRTGAKIYTVFKTGYVAIVAHGGTGGAIAELSTVILIAVGFLVVWWRTRADSAPDDEPGVEEEGGEDDSDRTDGDSVPEQARPAAGERDAGDDEGIPQRPSA